MSGETRDIVEQAEEWMQQHYIQGCPIGGCVAEIKRLREALAPVSRLEWFVDDAHDDAVVMMSVGTVRKMRAALLDGKE